MLKFETALLVLLTGATPSLAVTPVAGDLFHGDISYIANGEFDFNNGNSDLWVGTPRSLAAASGGRADNPATGGYVETAGESAATWTNANAGTVETATSFAFAAPDPADAAQQIEAVMNWVYVFRADRNGSFSLVYDIAAPTDLLPQSSWSLSWARSDGPATSVRMFDPANPVFAGTFDRPLVAGVTYEVAVVIGIAEFTMGNFAPATGRASFSAVWSIDEPVPPPPPPGGDGAVPEPASWAMFIAGFGLVGGALRRSRPATA